MAFARQLGVLTAYRLICVACQAGALAWLVGLKPASFTRKCLLVFMAGLLAGDVGELAFGGWRAPLEQDQAGAIAVRLSYRVAMLAFCVLVVGSSYRFFERSTLLSPQLWLGLLVAAPFDYYSLAALLSNAASASPLLILSELVFHFAFLMSFALSVIVLASSNDSAWLVLAAGVAQSSIALLGLRAAWLFGLQPPSLTFYKAIWTVAAVLMVRGTYLLAGDARPLPRLSSRSIYRTVKTLLMAIMFVSVVLLFFLEGVTERTVQVACLAGTFGIAIVVLAAYACSSLDRAFFDAVQRSLRGTGALDATSDHNQLPLEHQHAIAVVVAHHLGALEAQAERETQLRLDNARMQARHQISRQVAHDIRSPLAALEVVVARSEIAGMPEPLRDLVYSAVERIRIIVKGLVHLRPADPPAAPSRHEQP